MPIPITPKPQFPNVPITPGVPPVLRRIGQIQNTVVLLVADTFELINLFAPSQWGLFTADGAPAFGGGLGGIGGLIQSVISNGLSALNGPSSGVGELEFRNDHQISTAPQEEGAFLSYNKVSNPFAGRVTYLLAGSEAQRTAFLQSVIAAQQSLTLYTLSMPEYSYPSCNVVHNGFRRTAHNGVSMFAVDIWVQEVRVVGTTQFSNTALPSGASQVNTGAVQPTTPTPTQQSGVTRIQ